MENQESVVITETSADGTETTIEITTTNDNGESVIEEVFEALIDVEADGENVDEDMQDSDVEAADQNEFEVDSGDNTFYRGDYTDIGTGSDGETTYVIGEDFSYID